MEKAAGPLISLAELNVFSEEIDSIDRAQGIRQLPLVQIGEAVLRRPACVLSKEDILAQETQELIQLMKMTMRAAPGVGLAAPQVGVSRQLIVIEDKVEYHCHLTSQQLAERERVEVPFQVIINPHLSIEEGTESVEFFEGCLSVPNLMGVVPRAKCVRVTGFNAKAQPISIQATGWYARILQHEIDHLRGILFIDRVRSHTLMTKENYNKLWKEKSIAEVKQALCSP